MAMYFTRIIIREFGEEVKSENYFGVRNKLEPKSLFYPGGNIKLGYQIFIDMHG